MLRRVITTACAVFAGVLQISAVARADEPGHPDLPIAGVMGLRGQTEQAWIAVRVNVANSNALAGIMWYNNDSQVTFPQLRVGSGSVAVPGAVEDAVVVAESVGGESSSWSTVTFSEPIGASVGTVYLYFEIPVGTPYENPGEGGGAALGYFAEPTDSRGWISGDGEEWAALGAAYSFAVEPELVPYQDGMTVLGADAAGHIEMLSEVPEKAFLHAGPNPFNPRIELKFGVPLRSRVKLNVYDIRGMRVATVADQVFTAGEHSVFWAGRDSGDRRVASGVYFVRMENGGEALTQRVLLVK